MSGLIKSCGQKPHKSNTQFHKKPKLAGTTSLKLLKGMATTSTTGDPPPQQPTPTTISTTNTTKPSTLTPPPLTRPTATPPQIQPRPPQFLHHHPPYRTGAFAPPTSIQTQTHLLPHLGKPSDTIRYPLASSGRGLIPTHNRGGSGGIHIQFPDPLPSYPQIPSWNHNSRAHPTTFHTHIVRPPFWHHPSSQGPTSHLSAATVAAASGGVQFNNIHHPLSKVGSSPYSVPDSNAPNDLIDKKPEDLLVNLRDQKVRVSDGASLYALCRSWLRNGYPEDIQPQYGDVLISLPKPLPLPESSSFKRKERDDETEVDKVETDGILNAEELLTRHVKRAKRVRARLREERSQRIERYKSRLALLLPQNGTIQE